MAKNNVITTQAQQPSSILNSIVQVGGHCPTPNRRSKIWCGIFLMGDAHPTGLLNEITTKAQQSLSNPNLLSED